ncbi:MAG: hypothetical protein ACOVQN_01205, partial [Exiguobacterium sp.]
MEWAPKEHPTLSTAVALVRIAHALTACEMYSCFILTIFMLEPMEDDSFASSQDGKSNGKKLNEGQHKSRHGDDCKQLGDVKRLHSSLNQITPDQSMSSWSARTNISLQA